MLDRRDLPVACALLVALLLVQSRVCAQDAAGGRAAQPAGAAPRAVGPDVAQPTLVWKWPTFRTAEYVAIIGFTAASFAGAAIPVGDGRWTRRNEFDEAVRSGLRASHRTGRRRADDISDVTVALVMNHTLADALIVAWAVHGRESVAFQLTLIDLEALAFTRAVTAVVKSTIARERPYGEECEGDSTFAKLDNCTGSERYRSFVSGHSSTAFTAASLTCIHHAYLPLYGGGAPDALACIGALGLAGATATLRSVADEHHATDLITGALIGTASGLGIPWLLHYRYGPPRARAGDEAKIAFVPAPSGAALLGEF